MGQRTSLEWEPSPVHNPGHIERHGCCCTSLLYWPSHPLRHMRSPECGAVQVVASGERALQVGQPDELQTGE